MHDVYGFQRGQVYALVIKAPERRVPARGPTVDAPLSRYQKPSSSSRRTASGCCHDVDVAALHCAQSAQSRRHSI